MSLLNRRRDLSPPRGGGNNGISNVGSSKLRMDREPVVARITDPSLIVGKRKEIDNVMKKARANSTNEFWDKKLLEVEEKDPNRWRHTGYKKLYIEGDDSSSESEKDHFRYNSRKSRSRSVQRNRRTPPNSPRRLSPRSPDIRRRSPKSPEVRRPRSPIVRRRSPVDPRRRPKSPELLIRRKSPKSPRSPVQVRRKSPQIQHTVRRRSPVMVGLAKPQPRAQALPRSKRPPSPPPPKAARSQSNSSVSSCSDDSCSVCSPKMRRVRSRSPSLPVTRPRQVPRSPPTHHHSKPSSSSTVNTHHHRVQPQQQPHAYPPQYQSSHHAAKKSHVSQHHVVPPSSSSRSHQRPASPPVVVRPTKHRVEEKVQRSRPVIVTEAHADVPHKRHQTIKNRAVEDPRLKARPPPEPASPAPVIVPPKKSKTKTSEKLRAKVKIEGEKRRRRSSSSGSDDSSSSENSLPTFTATTRLTLSERFGKMAQWSIDRSNMENMRITKDSAGGALKVMIEEGLESPPRRYSYSPAPVGHFPEELALTAPSGLMSWDDVRVRYEYYKNRGYLRDLNLQDYIKWEEWWYKYQEWLKQERYYEFWERQQMNRRRRKKLPIAQRLN